MADFYIDPTQVTNGSGTYTSPFNAVPVFASNNRYFFKRGTTLTTTVQIARPGGVNNVQLLSYGDGNEYPHIRGVFDPTDATQSTIQLANSQGWIIKGLRISRSLPDVFRAIAVLDLRGSTVKDANLLIEDCVIEGGGDSIRIIDNINNVTLRRLEVFGAFTDGIWCRTGNNVVIESCKVYGQGVGDETNSDPIQFSEHTGTAYVINCDVSMRPSTIKQGIFFQTSAGGHSVAIGNTIRKTGAGGASIAIEGSGVVARNLIIGNTLRGVSITSTASNQEATINSNIIVGEWSGASYGIFVSGSFSKNLKIQNNTIIGNWQRAITIESGSMPAGSSFVGGNNFIDSNGYVGSVAIRNDSGFAITSFNDSIINTTSNTSGSVTLSGNISIDGIERKNYTPNSALGTAGRTLGHSKDITGKYFDNPPSIGAYQYRKPRNAR